MKKKINDFLKYIIKFRNEGKTFDEIVFWLAKNKKFLVTPSGIRAAIKRQEAMNILKNK